MANLYAKLALKAEKAMKRYGIPKTGAAVKAYVRRGGTDHPVVALESDFTPRERGDGSVFQRTDVRYLVSDVDLAIVPTKETDTFVLKDDSVETEFLLASEPKRIAPDAMTVVFWDFHCRTK